MSIAYGIFNLGIALSYLVIAMTVLPHINVNRFWVTVSAILFFATCAFTHADMAAHSFYNRWPEYPEMHAFINHAVQVVAAWAFMVGLYLEVVKDGLGQE